MLILDHVLVIVIAVVHPVLGYFSFQRLMMRAATGMRIDRLRLYNGTLASHWVLFAIAIAIWTTAGRTPSGLGMTITLHGGFVLAAVLTAAGIALLLRQLNQVVSSGVDQLRRLRAQLGNVEVILPASLTELNRFTWVALTAGIVEETLWRGYLFWYLRHFMPLWAAALVSTVGFGLAHAYQGFGNVPRIIAVGAAFALLYMLSGSIWLPILLHAIVDLVQGRLAYEVVERTKPAGGGDAPTQ
jgi:membrane protease YdiL (CAAX protease family)